jgi:hypothetical protein
VRRRGETLGVPGFIVLLRLVMLVPLFFFGEFSLFCAAFAVAHARHDTGPALIFAAVALISTLGYPALVEFEHRLGRGAQPPAVPWPIAVYDLFFLGGGMFAVWKLDGRQGVPSMPVLIGLALLLWIISGSVARRRLADLRTDTTAPKQKR